MSHTKVNADALNAADISTSMCSSESDNNLDINGDRNGHQRQTNLITPRNEEQVVVNINHAWPSSKLNQDDQII